MAGVPGRVREAVVWYVNDQGLTVRLDRHGPVWALTFDGELDLIAAPGVVAQVMGALPGPAAAGAVAAERLVLDLSGLTFLDCAGARALASVTRAVLANCPVIVRAISPEAARLLDLLGIRLEFRPAAPMTDHPQDRTRQLVRRSQALQSSGLQTMGQLVEVAEALAATEERVAASLAVMARQCPDWVVRLTQLSEQASHCAAASRRWAHASSARLKAGARSFSTRTSRPSADEVDPPPAPSARDSG